MNTQNSINKCNCSCCRFSAGANFGDLTRRDFISRVGAATAGLGVLSMGDLFAGTGPELPKRGPLPARPLTVQPVLVYNVPVRREGTSWRGWGGIKTEEQAKAEAGRIDSDLQRLQITAGFPLEIAPVTLVSNGQQASALKGDADVRILYAAGGGRDVLERLVQQDKRNLMFLRHDPGPVYLWYEIAHPWFLRKATDDYLSKGLDVHDIVVDKTEDLLWRLRGLHGLQNTLGKRIVAIGGAGGWGPAGAKAPEISRNLWKMDVVEVPYKDLEPKLKAALDNADLVKRCDGAAKRYLKGSGVSLKTKYDFVRNAFVLNEVMKDLMDEARTDAITIQHCMGTIMGISKTTACLPLSLMNDHGYLAFCESDFVVIPSGILLHYISGYPVFLNDPTTPHDGMVTLAHCTAPRKLDGKHFAPAKILTHFESDYGAAPKVEMKLGQVCTNLVPDFASKKWVGFEGKIVANPFLDICRSQVDVKINGDSTALLEQMRGFHWMMSYGDFLKETGYALRKAGIEFQNVSASKVA